MVRAAIALLLLIVVSSAALAEARFALLIGNQYYDPSVGVLKNPHNDVALVGEALAKQGFEVLPPVKDGKRSAILGAVRDLVRHLNSGGSGAIGFIYYSGHGAAEKDTNINYLIPVDAKEPGTTAFWDESVKLDDVLRLLDGARSAAKFVVFDACRNELQLPTKDTSKGLVPVAEQQGMFIAYASAPGRTASDRGEKSGPYASALAAELAKPGLDHLNLFQNVKEAVLASSGGAQQPWESNGLGRRVYLTGQPKSQEPAPISSEADRAWAWIKDTIDQSVLVNFIKQFGDTPSGALARARLEELKKQQVAAVPPAASEPVRRPTGEQLVSPPSTKPPVSQLPPPSSLEGENTLPPVRPGEAARLFSNTCSHCHKGSQDLANGRNASAVAQFLQQHYTASAKEANVLAAYLVSERTARPEVNLHPQPGSVNQCDGIKTTVGAQVRCLKPKDTFKDCDTCPEMVVVPAGEFVMGSNDSDAHENEKPVHKVTVVKPFAVGAFEVTVSEYLACSAAKVCRPPEWNEPGNKFNVSTGSDVHYKKLGSALSEARHPIVGISRDDAKAYVAWITKRTRKPYRLLSEAEWEYAARGGSSAKYAWGDEIGKNRANCDGCGSQWDNKQTAPVGSFQANGFGLYDMHGNVWEWVADCEAKYTVEPSDGTTAPEIINCSRVVRGGAWSNYPGYQRAAVRSGSGSTTRNNYVGFRVARTLEP